MTNECTKASGIIFIKPTIIVTLLLLIGSFIVVIVNAAKTKEQTSNIAIVSAFIAGVKFIDGLFISVYALIFHFDLVNLVLVVLANLFPPICANAHFFGTALVNMNGRKCGE